VLVGVALFATVGSVSVTARAQRADDPCLTSPVEGQKLQREGKLLEARERFDACARNTCPTEIVQDCTRWARSVEDALPSVVIAARDSQGRDLLDVRVSIDGRDPAELSERAMSLDPGTHRFVFERAGSANIEQQVLLREGEKNRQIKVTFELRPTVTQTAKHEQPVRERKTTSAPVPAGAWIMGGVGVAALASFGTFAVVGINQRSRDGCDTGCTQAESDSVNRKFLVADVSLGVGIVALGIATWITLSRPEVVTRSGHAVDVTTLRF
jgi:hypothetical protein